jgi:hypothetical protein
MVSNQGTDDMLLTQARRHPHVHQAKVFMYAELSELSRAQQALVHVERSKVIARFALLQAHPRRGRVPLLSCHS